MIFWPGFINLHLPMDQKLLDKPTAGCQTWTPSFQHHHTQHRLPTKVCFESLPVLPFFCFFFTYKIFGRSIFLRQTSCFATPETLSCFPASWFMLRLAVSRLEVHEVRTTWSHLCMSFFQYFMETPGATDNAFSHWNAPQFKQMVISWQHKWDANTCHHFHSQL